MCATAIHAFRRGLSPRKQEAQSRLLRLLVSFWVAEMEPFSEGVIESTNKGQGPAQTLRPLNDVHACRLMAGNESPGLQAFYCSHNARKLRVNSLNDRSHFCRGFSHRVRFCLYMFLVTASLCLF